MARLFSVASWNVEHFSNEKSRAERIVKFLQGEGGGPARVPDVFAIFEVEGKQVYAPFMKNFPDHRFHLTEGKQTQEIFLGVHKRLPSFVTQRLEFKTQRDYQRPGLLLTIEVDGQPYSILFLHVRSGADPEDFGLRDASMVSAFNLRKAIEEAGTANFMALGDLNTMGIDDTAPFSTALDFSAADEIERLAKWAERRDMTLVDKDQPATWWNGSDGYDPSNLDHLLAADHLHIRRQDGTPGVSVLGWPQKTPGQIPGWLEKYSDHAMLYFEVWTD